MLKDSAPDSNRPRRIDYKVTKASSNPFHLFVRDVTRLHTCLSPFDDLLPFNEASTTSWTTPAKAWPSTFSEGPAHSLTSLYRISTATRLHDNVCKLREGTVRDHDLCREDMYLRPIITKNESLGKSHSMPAIHHAGKDPTLANGELIPAPISISWAHQSPASVGAGRPTARSRPTRTASIYLYPDLLVRPVGPHIRYSWTPSDSPAGPVQSLFVCDHQF